MDRRTIIGFLLILSLLLIWPYLNNLIFGPPEPPGEAGDTTAVEPSGQPSGHPDAAEQELWKSGAEAIPATIAESPGEVLDTEAPEKTITVETSDLICKLSSRGGILTQVFLKKYTKFDSAMVSLIGQAGDPDWNGHGALTIGHNDVIPDFNDFNFIVESDTLVILENDSVTSIAFTYLRPDGASITKTYTFRAQGYLFDLDLKIKSPEALGMVQGVTIGWFAPMDASELNPEHDRGKLGGVF